ncbi:YbhB/YbcL family Raf kinase inhibitor-like protein [Saccharomonospora sp. NPDC046836]|uniref:YbhB/YbcL family Raf kinase inhibitor-like protein n=1 Tax=Saccharomonospora sp. NPDC046836 TaxID=3156921 RepID=UPI003410AB0D
MPHMRRGRSRTDREESQPDQPADDARRQGNPKRAAKGDHEPANDEPPGTGNLELHSAAFSDHMLIPERYSRQGGNVSPPLEWGQAPDGTVELALLCEDPDAPGGTFTHWVVTGLPADCGGVREGSLPSGATTGSNGFGDLGWGGPQPPVGDNAHRYFFRVYAVDRPLGLGSGATGRDVHAAVAGHTLASGTLMGLFAR